VIGKDMTTQIFKLKNIGQEAHSSQAQRICAHLESLGFGCEDLEDLIYHLAEEISLKLKEEYGASTAQRMASQEFTAAEEISQNSMIDQVIVLRQSCESDDALRTLLIDALRTELPQELFIASETI
jgi:hypothetical protein